MLDAKFVAPAISKAGQSEIIALVGSISHLYAFSNDSLLSFVRYMLAFGVIILFCTVANSKHSLSFFLVILALILSVCKLKYFWLFFAAK